MCLARRSLQAWPSSWFWLAGEGLVGEGDSAPADQETFPEGPTNSPESCPIALCVFSVTMKMLLSDQNDTLILLSNSLTILSAKLL